MNQPGARCSQCSVLIAEFHIEYALNSFSVGEGAKIYTLRSIVLCFTKQNMYPQCSGLQGTVITVRLNSWARSRKDKIAIVWSEKVISGLSKAWSFNGAQISDQARRLPGVLLWSRAHHKTTTTPKVWMLNVAKKRHSNYSNLVKVWQRNRIKFPKVSPRRYRRDLSPSVNVFEIWYQYKPPAQKATTLRKGNREYVDTLIYNKFSLTYPCD